jgi:hypothetical protein
VRLSLCHGVMFRTTPSPKHQRPRRWAVGPRQRRDWPCGCHRYAAWVPAPDAAKNSFPPALWERSGGPNGSPPSGRASWTGATPYFRFSVVQAPGIRTERSGSKSLSTRITLALLRLPSPRTGCRRVDELGVRGRREPQPDHFTRFPRQILMISCRR